MENKNLRLYNSLTRQKETFHPIHEGRIGMYVCGPTVYSDVHLGNCRTFMCFDIIYRYLLHSGYKVRYVRNITDVGHLVGDVDTGGEDKIAKKARLEQLEPMEVVQTYTNGFHQVMQQLNLISPSIEPTATGHILEQIEMVQQILDNGYAYIKNGSVYFKTLKFANDHKEYGQLSGKILDDLISESRDLKNQNEKEHSADFAIWVKAAPEHIMRWESPWGTGFPGWHLECSVMSTKYLGERFDIHGGGMDLKFPHHENEIAQNIGCCGTSPAKYWLHTNMLTMNGTKMSKSLGNSIMPHELFTGSNKLMSQAYSPMTVRFFILQTHYRSTIDFSDEALQAAEKGYRRLMEANKALENMTYTQGNVNESLDTEINNQIAQMYADMNDDFNSPKALATMFELVRKVNSFKDGHMSLGQINEITFNKLQNHFKAFIYDIFGLLDENEDGDTGVLDGLMELLIDIRQMSRKNKDFATSDKIRDELTRLGIQLKDGKEGTAWVLS